MAASHMLTDETYLGWLADGWIEVAPVGLDEADHQHLYDRATDLYALARQPQNALARRTRSGTAHLDILGDNLRAQIPELDDLLADPAVDGALTSILGPDYLVHPHSYCHRSGPDDQVFHQDGNLPWNERGHQRVHRPDWVMVFYYPQEVDDSNGATEVVPGSQYWTVDHELEDDEWHRDDRLVRGEPNKEATSSANLRKRDRLHQEILDAGFGIEGLPRQFVHVPAGTVVIAHYDLVHRGSRSAVEDPRYMYKFYCARTTPPAPGGAAIPDLDQVRPELAPIVAEAWRWSRGGTQVAPPAPDVPELTSSLVSEHEDLRGAAAYNLAAIARGDAPTNEIAVEVLAGALNADIEGVRRAASHGLRAAGAGAVDALVAGLDSEVAGVRRVAAAGLGGLPVDLPAEQVARITDRLCAEVADDPDDLVRSNSAYSLGQLARAPHADPERIGTALLGRLAPGAEPINATSWELARSTVRQSAAFAMVQLLANHPVSEAVLDATIDGPLRDDDRYVQGLIVDAVSRSHRITPPQLRRAMNLLNARRWNPTPKPHGTEQ